MRIAVGLVSLLFILLVTPPAAANFVGNDTQNFNPNTSGLDFVTVEGSQTLAPGVFSASLYANETKNSLPDTVDTSGAKVPSNDLSSSSACATYAQSDQE